MEVNYAWKKGQKLEQISCPAAQGIFKKNSRQNHEQSIWTKGKTKMKTEFICPKCGNVKDVRSVILGGMALIAGTHFDDITESLYCAACGSKTEVKIDYHIDLTPQADDLPI